MTSRKIFTVMAVLALMAISSIANAGIVDPVNSFATLANPGIMTIAPGGADSFVFPNDYTIDVYLRDLADVEVEVVNTDIWLDDPAVVWCAGGVNADSSTYAPDPGHTTFSGTPRGGVAVGADCSAITIDVVAVGNVIESLPLAVNSPDLNGDGAVTVGDFGVFGTAFGAVLPCADFDESGGVVAVADFAIFASFFNISNCP